jgi:hypothetical protein
MEGAISTGVEAPLRAHSIRTAARAGKCGALRDTPETDRVPISFLNDFLQNGSVKHEKREDMKTLVIYYSFEGNTRRIAETIMNGREGAA